MKKKKRIHRKKGTTKAAAHISLILLFAGIALCLLWIKNPTLFTIRGQTGKIIMLFPNPETAHPNLQLQTFPYIILPALPSGAVPITNQNPPAGTIHAPAGGYCALDDLKPSGSSCSCLDSNAVACPAVGGSATSVPTCQSNNIAMQLPPGSGKWYCIQIGSPGITNPIPPPPPQGCSAACIAKPVVYLYPEKKTTVTVSVTVPGEIFMSDPQYPKDGWENIEAYPDGTLYYQGKKYSELFYESTVTKKIEMPESGIIIKNEELEPELRRITTQLGLIKHEQEEFLEYWVPALKQLKSPYIFFSVFSPEVKDSLDRLTISPEPNTRIEFIAYFKPLQTPITVKPLALPEAPQQRIGFTEVEWGGTISRF